MSEPLHLAAEATAPETLLAPRSFEAFYDAESRTLFRCKIENPTSDNRRQRERDRAGVDCSSEWYRP